MRRRFLISPMLASLQVAGLVGCSSTGGDVVAGDAEPTTSRAEAIEGIASEEFAGAAALGTILRSLY